MTPAAVPNKATSVNSLCPFFLIKSLLKFVQSDQGKYTALCAKTSLI